MEEDSPLPSNNVRALVSFYSSYFHNRLRTFLPLSLTSEDGWLSRIANFYGSSKRRRRKTCLPLPLPSAAAAASLDRSPAAMLELDQILRANEINFAILAALPAFFLSLILAMLVRAWFKQDTRAEGRERVARIQRRLLLVEIERAIMQFQSCKDQGLENDAQCMYGLVLCFLDSLYTVVEGHAKATGEWICLRQDIIDLAKPGLQTEHKLRVAWRMERVYECLLPSSKRH
ncbi:UNVERIFIED_CONTAM: protein DGS1, mitochondrial [Sesamum radiatum]|uniref:Protein DGS1, mitochondrial n=1 Tax=Sesamum radiatum TaxID=300843 RepID=A0AAW2W787_SESRA